MHSADGGRGRGRHGGASSASRGRTSSSRSSPTPLAAGTIGQVHRATLEGGDRVVVKVQRPNAATDIYRDLGLLELFAAKTADRPAFRQLVDIPAVDRAPVDVAQTRARLPRWRRRTSTGCARCSTATRRLEVPAVYEELSSARLLVMQEIEGVPVREAPRGPRPERGRAPAARVVLRADPESRLLPRRPAPRAT